jgi:hypothetical protein
MDKFKNMLLLQLSSNLNSFCVFKEKTILEGGIFFWWRVEFFKIGKRDFKFIREMRVFNKPANSKRICIMVFIVSSNKLTDPYFVL